MVAPRHRQSTTKAPPRLGDEIKKRSAKPNVGALLNEATTRMGEVSNILRKDGVGANRLARPSPRCLLLVHHTRGTRGSRIGVGLWAALCVHVTWTVRVTDTIAAHIVSVTRTVHATCTHEGDLQSGGLGVLPQDMKGYVCTPGIQRW